MLCKDRHRHSGQSVVEHHSTESIQTTEFLHVTFPGQWIGRGGPLTWPVCSQDLTPCDFWLWSIVKECVYVTKPHIISESVLQIS